MATPQKEMPKKARNGKLHGLGIAKKLVDNITI